MAAARRLFVRCFHSVSEIGCVFKQLFNKFHLLWNLANSVSLSSVHVWFFVGIFFFFFGNFFLFFKSSREFSFIFPCSSFQVSFIYVWWVFFYGYHTRYQVIKCNHSLTTLKLSNSYDDDGGVSSPSHAPTFAYTVNRNSLRLLEKMSLTLRRWRRRKKLETLSGCIVAIQLKLLPGQVIKWLARLHYIFVSFRFVILCGFEFNIFRRKIAKNCGHHYRWGGRTANSETPSISTFKFWNVACKSISNVTARHWIKFHIRFFASQTQQCTRRTWICF